MLRPSIGGNLGTFTSARLASNLFSRCLTKSWSVPRGGGFCLGKSMRNLYLGFPCKSAQALIAYSLPYLTGPQPVGGPPKD